MAIIDKVLSKDKFEATLVVKYFFQFWVNSFIKQPISSGNMTGVEIKTPQWHKESQEWHRSSSSVTQKRANINNKKKPYQPMKWRKINIYSHSHTLVYFLHYMVWVISETQDALIAGLYMSLIAGLLSTVHESTLFEMLWALQPESDCCPLLSLRLHAYRKNSSIQV